jgi:hypothetical protein
MLTIGNFLGGQWANESWGRYWDGKETWALSQLWYMSFMLVCTFFTWKMDFQFDSMFAFISTLFTDYGVNFHLVDCIRMLVEKHIIGGSWYSLGAISLFGVISYPKNIKNERR